MKSRLALGVALAVTLLLFFFGARTAAAEERIYLSLSGQKQGAIAGDATAAGHAHQFIVQGFSASPDHAGASPVSVSVSLSLYALPNLFAALTGNEAMTATFATYAVTSGRETKERTVSVQNAYVTDLSFSTSPGSAFTVSATLSTVAPLVCTEASGSACAGAVPGILAAAEPSKGGATISAQIATARAGKVQPTVTNVAWRVGAPLGGFGRPLLQNVALTTGAGAASQTLAAAVAGGDSIAGTTITWTGPSGYVVKMTILSGKLQNEGAAGTFDVTFQPAPPGSAMLQLTRSSPPAAASY